MLGAEPFPAMLNLKKEGVVPVDLLQYWKRSVSRSLLYVDAREVYMMIALSMLEILNFGKNRKNQYKSGLSQSRVLPTKEG